MLNLIEKIRQENNSLFSAVNKIDKAVSISINASNKQILEHAKKLDKTEVLEFRLF